MIYNGQFRDKNGVLYSLQINTGGGVNTDITLSATPIVVEMQSDDDLFKPVKYTSATVGVIATDYMFDVYNPVPQQVSVILKNNTEQVVWMGYVSPSAYDMGFENDKELLELECIDDLATLQYYKYETDNPQFKSFLDIITGILKGRTRYKKLYVADRFKKDDILIKLDELYVSEENFKDSDDNWTEQKVIEEICNYLNLTMVADGDDVWMLNDNNHFTVYDLVNDNQSDFTLSARTHIDGDDYALNGSTISLNPCYNKVSVTAKLNTYDTIFPDLFDDIDVVTNQFRVCWNNEIYTTGLREIGTDKAYYAKTDNPNYKFFTYDKDSKQETQLEWTNDVHNFISNIRNNIGGYLLKARFEKIEENGAIEGINDFTANPQKDMTDYLLLACHSVGQNIPLMQTTEKVKTYFNDRNIYLVLNFNALFMDKPNWEYIPSDYEGEQYHRYPTDNDFERYLYIPAKLKWGDYYYHNGGGYYGDAINNGYSVGGMWTKDEGLCRLQLETNDDKQLFNTQFKTLDTSGYYSVKLDSGLVIPPPPVMMGYPQLTIYSMDSEWMLGQEIEYIWISDFKMNVCIPQRKSLLNEDESDTVYENVISEEYVENKNDIDCEINTYDGKKTSFSYVLFKRGNDEFSYIDEVVMNKSNELHRIEEHKIYDYVIQYQQPTIRLKLNMKDCNIQPFRTLYVDVLDANKRFVVDGYTADICNSINNINIVEKI